MIQTVTLNTIDKLLLTSLFFQTNVKKDKEAMVWNTV